MAAFFTMQERVVSSRRAHQLFRDLVAQLGRSRCGRVCITNTCEHGEYFLIFESRETADRFERMYRRETGVPPQRSSRKPDGLVVGYTEVLVSINVPLMSRRDYERHVASRWN